MSGLTEEERLQLEWHEQCFKTTGDKILFAALRRLDRPETLEALTAMVERFGWLGTPLKGAALERDREVIDHARAAIAKATGAA